jgi:HAD superfamily hydrolase (TIGR01549 family)
MKQQKYISFDVEGTLITTEFSYSIWYEVIPRLYAEKHGIDIEIAQQTINSEIEHTITDPRPEYFEIQYWFDKFSLGEAAPAILQCRNRIRQYSNVPEILEYLGNHYRLVICSGTPRTALQYLVQDIAHYFYRIFSSVTDFNRLKVPGFYRDVCAELGASPDEIVHIGDNWQYDCLNAQEAGLMSFHISHAPEYRRENSLKDLLELKDRLKPE